MAQVSIVIPLDNKGVCVRRAVDSILAQTYRDYEIIVIDDGLTDDGPATVRRYHDSRLRLIHQENAGPGAARSRGIRESSGLYATFLDADDEWLPEFLMTNVSILKAHLLPRPDAHAVRQDGHRGLRFLHPVGCH